MKYLVISDIHGDYIDLMRALDKFFTFSCDKILILGDILYHGPRNSITGEYDPYSVIDALNKLKDKIIAIKGNCDAEVDEMVLSFPLYKKFMVKVRDTYVILVHGHHLEECDEKDKYYLFGHSHKNIVYGNMINLGSISLPKDGIKSYAIMDEDKISAYEIEDDRLVFEVKF